MVSAVPGYGTKTLANLLEVVEGTLLLFNLHMYPVGRKSKKNRRNLSEQLQRPFDLFLCDTTWSRNCPALGTHAKTCAEAYEISNM